MWTVSLNRFGCLYFRVRWADRNVSIKMSEISGVSMGFTVSIYIMAVFLGYARTVSQQKYLFPCISHFVCVCVCGRGSWGLHMCAHASRDLVMIGVFLDHLSTVFFEAESPHLTKDSFIYASLPSACSWIPTSTSEVLYYCQVAAFTPNFYGFQVSEF